MEYLSSMENNRNIRNKTNVKNDINFFRKKQERNAIPKTIRFLLVAVLVTIWWSNVHVLHNFDPLDAFLIDNTTDYTLVSNDQMDDSTGIDQISKKVADYEATLATITETIKSLQAENEDLREKLKTRNEEQKEGKDDIDSLSSADADTGANDVCTHFMAPPSQLTLASSSTDKIWRHHIPQIFNHSRHTDDQQFNYHDFTAMLLDFVTPRLRNSVKNLRKSYIIFWFSCVYCP